MVAEYIENIVYKPLAHHVFDIRIYLNTSLKAVTTHH